MSLRVIEGGAAGETTRRSKAGPKMSPNPAIAGSGLADYIWVDAAGQIYVKKRAVVMMHGGRSADADNIVPIIPTWSYTHGELGRVLLSPCNYLPDPLRPQPSYVVLCEVRSEADNSPHDINTRAKLRTLVTQLGGGLNAEGQAVDDRLGTRWGFTQSYRLTDPNGVPASFALCTQVSERHVGACLDAGLMLHSAQIDIPPWTFSLGERDFPPELDPDPAVPLVVADHLIIARYLLVKAAQEVGLRPRFSDVLMQVSTKALREGKEPVEAITTPMLTIPERSMILQAVRSPDTGKVAFITGRAKWLNIDPYQAIITVLSKLADRSPG